MTERQKVKDEAFKVAKRLQQKLGGKWKVNVWENLGWHYSVTLGSISVHRGDVRKKNYFAFVSPEENDPSGGAMFWTPSDMPYDKYPEIAVKRALSNVKTFIAGCQKLHESNLKLLNSTLLEKIKV